MPYSYAQYAGGGTTGPFTVPFPYLLRAHVRLYTQLSFVSGGYEKLYVDGIDYNWINATQIQLTQVLAVGKTLTIRRETPTSARLVEWNDGSTVDMADLNIADLQNFYAVQEQEDYIKVVTLTPSSNIEDGAITESKLSSNAVSTAKLQDGAVTTGKIANGTILNEDINANAGISAAKLTYAQAGAVARTVDSKLKDWVSVKDYGAVGDGVTDDTSAIRAAVTASNAVYFPPGVYRIREAILIHRSGVVLFGAGAGVSVIVMYDASTLANYSAIDVRTSRANNGAGGSITDVTIRDLTIDGNKANRSTTAGNGIIILCDSAHQIQRTRIKGVVITDCVGFGILLEGYNNGLNDGNKVENTVVDGCSVFGNRGIGLSQFKTNNSTIVNNVFGSNGLENLTIDVYSQACLVDGNRFFRHLGGTGNIGIDSGDACIISNNFIDNELNTSAATQFRTGISLNSQLSGGGGNVDVVITGNCIISCASYGIYVHDDTGGSFGSNGGFTFNGEAGGNAVITGNNFAGNGTDIRIENGVGPTIVKSNKLATLVVTDPGVSDVRVGSGDVAFDAYLSSSQTITIPSNDNAWRKITLGGISARLATLNAGNLILPIGGFYQFNVKARLEGLSAMSTDYVSVALGHQPIGGTETIFSLINFDPNSTAAVIDDVTEFTLPYAAFLAAGTIRLYMRVKSSTPGSVTLKDGFDTRLTGYSVG